MEIEACLSFRIEKDKAPVYETVRICLSTSGEHSPAAVSIAMTLSLSLSLRAGGRSFLRARGHSFLRASCGRRSYTPFKSQRREDLFFSPSDGDERQAFQAFSLVPRSREMAPSDETEYGLTLCPRRRISQCRCHDKGGKGVPPPPFLSLHVERERETENVRQVGGWFLNSAAAKKRKRVPL
jgi:hypothetical protein